MRYQAQQLAFPLELHPSIEDWTFNGASTRELTHCYHDYPARMIPQISSKLLDMFAAVDARVLFDPYCGTGTSLVEGLIRGLNVIGTDLNPLARLIAIAKTNLTEISEIDKLVAKLNKSILKFDNDESYYVKEIKGINRLEFWFKPNVIKKISFLKRFIDQIANTDVKIFFQVAFSETVRECSNTRNEEFKLYRYDSEKLHKFDPDVFGIITKKIKRNRSGLCNFIETMKLYKSLPKSRIYDFNSVLPIPENKVKPESVDIVVTSPPYGDSHTTVAYGQYSRLSAAWLDMDDSDKIDNKLMGGKTYKKIPEFIDNNLNHSIHSIFNLDKKRAMEVCAFYVDLQNSILNVANVIKPGGYACYVVGNRKVKGVVLPTDLAIHSFFEQCGFDYIDTFHRSIPNKRMPSRNSPSNTPGIVDNTMVQEYIVVMRKQITKKLMEKRVMYSSKKRTR